MNSTDKAKVQQLIANAAPRTTTITTTSPFSRYEVSGYAADVTGEEDDGGGADAQPYVDEAVLYQQYGFYSQPGASSACVVTPAGQGAGTNLVILATEAPGTRPTDTADWEVGLYAQSGQIVRLLPDGSIVLLDSSGAGLKLSGGHVTNLGSQPVAVATSTDITIPTPAAGTDAVCTVTFEVTSPTTGPLITLTYAKPWATLPNVQISNALDNQTTPLSWVTTLETVTISAKPTTSAPTIPIGFYALLISSTANG